MIKTGRKILLAVLEIIPELIAYALLQAQQAREKRRERKYREKGIYRPTRNEDEIEYEA